MNESRLRILAVAVSILGLAGLLFISQVVEAPLIAIGDVRENLVDSPVHVAGVAKNVRVTKGVSMMSVVDDSGEILVVSFDEFPDGVQDGTSLEVYGMVKLYKNELEVVVEKLVVLE